MILEEQKCITETTGNYIYNHDQYLNHIGSSFLKCYRILFLVDFSFAVCKLLYTKRKLTGTLTVFYYPGDDDLPTLQTALIYTFSVVGLFSDSTVCSYQAIQFT